MLFSNRTDAGLRLAEALEGLIRPDLVLAVPRGGVVVGQPIAEKFSIPLDVIVPRKIGLPDNPELGVGAVAPNGSLILNEKLLSRLGVDRKELGPVIKREMREIERRTDAYRKNWPPLKVESRHVIVVDDGVATGYTMFAALECLKQQHAAEITVAIPVAPAETALELEARATRAVFLSIPSQIFSVGQFYSCFTQVSDAEVIKILGSGENNTDSNTWRCGDGENHCR